MKDRLIKSSINQCALLLYFIALIGIYISKALPVFYLYIDSAINIALNKRTGQSSGNNHGYAVDGNRESIYQKYSCTHTASSKSPWWRVDVGNVVRNLQLLLKLVQNAT